jgi:hypothetical protein
MSAGRTRPNVQGNPVALDPHPEEVAVLTGMRKSRLQSFSDRLGRVGQFPWPTMWAGLGTLLLGGAVGGAFGLIPFLSTDPRPSSFDQLVYIGLVGGTAVLAIVCFLAAATTRAERVESVRAIKEDFDKMLSAWPGPE